MGHFGKVPIRRAWNLVVFPSLVLNYAGQAAIVVEGAPTQGNIFYHLCPSVLLTPLVVLATIATIIASQSIITGGVWPNLRRRRQLVAHDCYTWPDDNFP